MNGRARAALEIWSARNTVKGDRAFVVYMAALVALVAVVPVGRAVWLSATSPAGIALFADGMAPAVTSLVVTALWTGALLLGHDRGPAVLVPFLTHALASSDLRGADIYWRPMLRSALIVTAVTTIAAATAGNALAQQGHAIPLDATVFAVAGALAGATASVLWLAGQVFPRAAAAASVGILALGALAFVVPATQPFLPAGWVALSYPAHASPQAVAALAALAVVLIAAVPALLNRLRLTALMTQSARWDSLVVHATGMDFAAAVTLYQPHPHLGRRLRAVRPRKTLAATFFVRDAIGSLRTPGRLIVGVGSLAAAGMLLALAFTQHGPVWVLGVTAGLIAFGGLGPLTDGLRHAASIASDFSPYGVSDGALVGLHSFFPLAVTIAVLLAATGTVALLAGAAPLAAMISALLLGLSALGIRLSSALKGPLPTALLAPIPTPMGDPMAAVRLVWALDAIVLAALVGASVVGLFTAPLFFVGVAGIIATTATMRWRARR